MTPNADTGARYRTVTLDIEVIQQWWEWSCDEDFDSLTEDLLEVLRHPERAQPVSPNGSSGTA